MMMMPRFLNGVNTAERVPIRMAAPPSRQASQASSRSLSFMAEFIATTGTLKRRRKRLMVWGVRPISGTITRACLPALSNGSRMLR
ncbi:hypothetical protein D3C72_1826780 [compost metagenome]